MPRKPGSDGSDTALFGMLRNKLPAALRDGKGIFDFGKPKSAAAKAPAPKAAAPAKSSSSASSSTGPRRMTAAERKANATRKEPVAPKRTPKVTVQEAPPARPTKPMKSPGRSGNMDEESFGKAFAHYRKAGNKTFTWRGKSYTTKTKEEV